MASFNKVILVGNLTRDPELRVTGTGLSICKIGLAVNRSYTSKDGESKDETTYVDVDAFGKQAEILGKYMQKGRPLMVEGRLKLDQWESNDGQKRSKLGVVLERFNFLVAVMITLHVVQMLQSQTHKLPAMTLKRNLSMEMFHFNL